MNAVVCVLLSLWFWLVENNAFQLSMQDSDGEKSDDNLVVDVSNEVRCVDGYLTSSYRLHQTLCPSYQCPLFS